MFRMADLAGTEFLEVCMLAMGRRTRTGYAVAVSDPVRGESRLMWFRSREAFVEAESLAGKDDDHGTELLSFSDAGAAIRVLMEVDEEPMDGT